MTCAQIFARAADARAQAQKHLDGTAGFCGLICRKLGYELAHAGVRVELIIGEYDDAYHAWLLAGGLMLDPAGDQFDADAPLLVCSERERRYKARLRLPLDRDEQASWTAQEIARLMAESGPVFGSAGADEAALRYLAIAGR